MVKLKKRLWYKCRHSGFKQDQLVEEYKSLNKTTKKSQKSMRKLIFFKKTVCQNINYEGGFLLNIPPVNTFKNLFNFHCSGCQHYKKRKKDSYNKGTFYRANKGRSICFIYNIKC
jgi:hypothetical protein